MQSRWLHLKIQAVQMRRKGTSIAVVEKSLQIPRSTLSGWFKNIILTPAQKDILEVNKREAIKTIYDYDVTKIKCDLHLRADQDPLTIKQYWSKELGVPMSNFVSISLDKRTIGQPTYLEYKGVCSVNCGNVALQRKLLYLSQRFCEQVVNLRAVSSVGRASA